MTEYIDALVAWARAMPMFNACVLLLIAHVLDIASTVDVLRHGGYEANPLMRWAISFAERLGLSPALGMALLKTALLIPLIYFADDSLPVLVVTLITALVVWHNTRVLDSLIRQALLGDKQ